LLILGLNKKPVDLTTLQALSPVDGRYRNIVNCLAPYFSEYGLIKYRLRVEIEYFIALCELPLKELEDFDAKHFTSLRDIYKKFNADKAQQIKNVEKITNHDVKAVEYYIKSQFDELGISKYKEFIHFGLTSQDINNTAIPLSFKESLALEFYPLLNEIRDNLNHLAGMWKDIPMLARTHGQPASPTRLGKEIAVFVARLDEQIKLLDSIPFAAKFGGATGNMNAHHVAYPTVDWVAFANNFVEVQLGLKRSYPTTQIEHYDHLAALFDNLKRINTILLDLSRDVWQYIAMNYFKQSVKEGEVGSSAMPHKVNPIDFENAEGNLGIANALFEHLSAKLPVSRLQRDLTDSTVLRNIGVPMAHTYLALKSIEKGLAKLELNKPAIDKDLEDNWAVVAEAIQTILRREGYPQPYEALKKLTRGTIINQESMHAFIDSLEIKKELKAQLKQITPFNYTGI
jgi:adenylosuccinate lyase